MKRNKQKDWTEWGKMRAMQYEMNRTTMDNIQAMICKSRQLGFTQLHQARLERTALFGGNEMISPFVMSTGTQSASEGSAKS